MKNTLRFKDLDLAEVFEFDHSDLTCNCGSICHGPWTKTGQRTYANTGGIENRVGSINARVNRGESCGHPYWESITRIAAAIERMK